jgi:hypothetical protein
MIQTVDFFTLGAFPARSAGNRAFRLYLFRLRQKRIPLQSLARFRVRGSPFGKKPHFQSRRDNRVDLFNNPVGCLTSLADLADFLQKPAKSAVFQRKLSNN